MPRKTSAELEKDAREQLAAANRRRAEERKKEQQALSYIQRLLGVYLERQLRTDAALRARVARDMNGFCTRARDRELFGLDESETYFDRLGKAKDDEPGGKGKAGTSKAADAASPGAHGGRRSIPGFAAPARPVDGERKPAPLSALSGAPVAAEGERAPEGTAPLQAAGQS